MLIEHLPQPGWRRNPAIPNFSLHQTSPWAATRCAVVASGAMVAGPAVAAPAASAQCEREAAPADPNHRCWDGQDDI